MPDHWGHEGGTGETAVGMDGGSGPEERDPGYSLNILP